MLRWQRGTTSGLSFQKGRAVVSLAGPVLSTCSSRVASHQSPLSISPRIIAPLSNPAITASNRWLSRTLQEGWGVQTRNMRSSQSVANSAENLTPTGAMDEGSMQESGGSAGEAQHAVHQGQRLEFKAETQKLLHIVAHSLYTDKEVFVRELISNASDALEKLRFFQSTGKVTSLLDAEVPLRVRLLVDSDKKTFTIEDSGVGMTRAELIDNLGTIAKSGSLSFLEDPSLNAKDKANAIIGQFGVGFYSAFVVSDKVEVFTRSFNEEGESQGWHWESDGHGYFEFKECPNLPRGTRIVCHLKDDCSEYCQISTVKQCAQKFSAYMSFPLFIKDGDKDVEVNTQQALWLKSTATADEHLNFYRHLSNASWGEPMYTLTYQTDAPISLKSLFYVPDEAPSRMFQTKSEVGVSLHSRRILVKKSADNVIPKWLFFIKGVIDCEDIPLNISRESTQDTRLINKLSHTIVRRILKFFDDQAKVDPEKYRKFHNQYSYFLKEGLLDDVQKNGGHKEHIMKLLRFECSEKDPKKTISLDQYLETAKPNQQNIYYFCASDRQTALSSPYMEHFCKLNRNVLLMYDDIDEFVAMNLQNYKDKKFVAIDSPDGDFEPLLESDEGTTKESEGENQGLMGDQRTELEDFIKGVLGEKVTAVKFSDRLVKSPAVVSGFLSSTLRKMMKATMRGSADGPNSMANLPVTLELNPSHRIITSLYHLRNTNPEIAKTVVEQLHDNACIAAGILDDPRTMLDRLSRILEVTLQYAYHHNSSSAPAKQNDQLNSEELPPPSTTGSSA